MNYKFSIGKVTIKNGVSTVKEIIPLQDVNIDYSLTVHEESNPDGLVTSESTDSKKTTINFSYSTTSTDISLISDIDYDLVFEANGDRGLEVTLAGCRLTGYTLKEAQANFVIVTLTFTKKGAIDSAPGSSPTQQTIQFGSTYIGDTASLITSYRGNTKAIIVPTLLGVLMRSTADLGGGQQEIHVKAFKKCSSRLELEQYLLTLYASLSTGSNTLTITYGGSSYTITKCYWNDGSPEGNNKTYGNFDLTFIRSAY
jgi:hypothetical protein